MPVERTKPPVNIYWQAHRGGGAHEAPDNTMGANRYAWSLGGIPEADLRTTKDGVIVCLHDETPARTTTAPDAVKDRPISSFTFAETREWDAGVKFSEAFKGERIPALEEMFAEMEGRPERLAYLDLKEVDLRALAALIDRYGVNGQVFFTHNDQDHCKRMKTIASGVRTMLWIMGEPEQIKRRYLECRDTGFSGLDQVQLHLALNEGSSGWPYRLEAEFLMRASAETAAAGIDLEVLPYRCDASAVHPLLDIGIRWYATDYPTQFLRAVESWPGLKS